MASMEPATEPAAKEMRERRGAQRVVVCGGGVIGVCAAYFLAKKGAAVTLIEKSSVACAASGKAGGFLAFDWCDGGPLSDLARASFELHRSLSEELDGPSHYGYRPLDTLSVVIKEQGGRPPGRISELPPWIDGPAHRPKTIGTTSTTAQVHLLLFTQTLLNTAVKRYGLEIEIGTVEHLEVANGRVRSVVLGGGRRAVQCNDVVLALGPWTTRFAQLSSIRVSGVKAHSIVLEPKEAHLISPHALFLTYYPSHGQKPLDPEVYPRPTGEVYVCGMSVEEDVPDNPEDVMPDPNAIQMLRRIAGTVSTHLKEGRAQVTVGQACFLPYTDDGLPVIGEITGLKGCYVATGHGCWGILNGPATGVILAELVVDGGASLVDIQKFNSMRFMRNESH